MNWRLSAFLLGEGGKLPHLSLGSTCHLHWQNQQWAYMARECLKSKLPAFTWRCRFNGCRSCCALSCKCEKDNPARHEEVGTLYKIKHLNSFNERAFKKELHVYTERSAIKRIKSNTYGMCLFHWLTLRVRLCSLILMVKEDQHALKHFDFV